MWRNDIKCKDMFIFTLKNLARKGLIFPFDLPADPINLALDKDAWQISDYAGNVAQRGNDGNFDPSLNNRGCSMTTNLYNAWWSVDLKKSYQITSVVVATRDSGSRCIKHIAGKCVNNFVEVYLSNSFYELIS